MGHVFLSYRSLERGVALKLTAALRGEGLNVWMDHLPGGLGVGDDWPKKLTDAIDACQGMVALLSPSYVRSDICLNELARAKQSGRPVFPALIEPIEPQDWPLLIQRVQYIDFSLWRRSDAFRASVEALFGRLTSSLGEIVGQKPDPEQQYLLSLIGDLEAHEGVARHIALAAELRETDRSELAGNADRETWNIDPEFQLLEAPKLAEVHASESRNVTFNDLAKLPKSFVITGDPGAGKTTTLRHLALRFARTRLEQPRGAPLPVYASLPSWQAGATAEQFVFSQWPFAASRSPALDDVVLLLDGLNEMGRLGSTNAVSLRRWLQSDRAPSRIALACRSQDYPNLDVGIDEIRIKPLDFARIKLLVTSYLSEHATDFLGHIAPRGAIAPGARDLSELAKNPYLLFAFMLVFRRNPDLPKNTGRLFRKICKFLWDKERNRNSVDWVPFEDVSHRLAELAFIMIDENRSVRISEELMAKYLGRQFPVRVALGANILVEADSELQFSHELIQEYFAAERLVSLEANEWTPRMSGRWSEVVVAAAGLSPESERFVSCVERLNPLLAGRCLTSGVGVSPQLKSAIESALSARLDCLCEWVIQKEIARDPESAMMIDDRIRESFSLCVTLEDTIARVTAAERFVYGTGAED